MRTCEHCGHTLQQHLDGLPGPGMPWPCDVEDCPCENYEER